MDIIDARWITEHAQDYSPAQLDLAKQILAVWPARRAELQAAHEAEQKRRGWR